VCDGAGSKPFSRIGAKAAAVTAAEHFPDEQITEQVIKNLTADTSEEAFTEAVGVIAETLRNTATAAAKAVEEAAQARFLQDPESFSADVSDYASTFLFALIVPLENGECLTACLSVGDGNIAAFCKDGETVRILGVGTHGDWSGETEFLQSEGVLTDTALKARTRIIREGISRVVLATDGVADDYFPNETEFSRLGVDIDEHFDTLADYLDTYYVRGSFDDRTLAVLDMFNYHPSGDN
jgi:serine/threonine protein phosphatase PrpC